MTTLRWTIWVAVGSILAVLGCASGGSSGSADDLPDAREVGDPGADAGGDSDAAQADAQEADAVEADAVEAEGPHACITSPACTRVMVAAHRGAHASHPENSLAAIRAAAELGADLAEVDVRHTSDDVLVLMHNGAVDATTDGEGSVDSLTWAQISALTLDDSDPDDPESLRVPRFADALALAAEMGIMLYVDQKTDRSDLVRAAIAEGPWYEQALLRDGLPSVAASWEADHALVVMPAIESTIELEMAREAIADLHIVELAKGTVDPALTGAITATGVKVQQDVMAAGDSFVLLADDYSGWRSFIDAGVTLLQTDLPELLVPAVATYNATGQLPDGPPGR